MSVPLVGVAMIAVGIVLGIAAVGATGTIVGIPVAAALGTGSAFLITRGITTIFIGTGEALEYDTKAGTRASWSGVFQAAGLWL
jgi:hypothetical protein